MVKYKIGDIIVSASSDSYVGEIIYISKEEDVVRHRCRKTGTEYEKSYFGFQCRYMTVEERLEKDKEFCTENIHLQQQVMTLERERDEALAQIARREREHEALLETAQKALAHERDDFRIVVGERDIAEAALCRVRRDAATEVAQRIAAEYRAVVAERERDALREALQQAILEGK